MYLFCFCLLSACSPQAQPTALPATAEGQPTHINVDLTPAQRAAISALSKNLGLTPDQIKIVSTEAVDWPDSCLGVTVEGFACSQVVTPGFRIVLEANGKQVEYHTNQDGTVIVPATVALTWSRNGGIAGFCDSLTIYLSGEAQGNNCKSGEMVEKNSRRTSHGKRDCHDEWMDLQVWRDQHRRLDPEGVSDAMSVKLTLSGTGTRQNMVQASQQLLLTFAQDLYQKLMSQ